jgi:hypothetical protein
MGKQEQHSCDWMTGLFLAVIYMDWEWLDDVISEGVANSI